MIRELGSFDERKSGRVGALEGGVPCLTCVRIPAPPAPGPVGGNSSSSTMLIVETSESVTRSNQEPAMIYVLLGVIITV